jgi:hypothetical protein
MWDPHIGPPTSASIAGLDPSGPGRHMKLSSETQMISLAKFRDPEIVF